MVNSKKVRHVNPFNRQDLTSLGEKRFPELFHRTIPTDGLTQRVKDFNPKSQRRKDNTNALIAGLSPLHLKRVERNGNKIATLLEFTELRYSPSYKHVFDMVGSDFPIHPEYLYAINVILNYFNVEYYDIIEFYKQSDFKAQITRLTDFRQFVNKPIAECACVIFYVLYVEYQWNPHTITLMFNSISNEQLRHSIGRFLRDYDRSDIFREVYMEIHSRLLTLEKLNK